MFKNESSLAFILVVLGAIMVLINGILIAANGAPVVISSYPAYSTNQLYANGSSFWGRLSLGIPGVADSAWLSIFLFVGVVQLLTGLLLLIQPKGRRNLSLIVIVCSLLSIPIGGGFIIGALLGIIGGLAGMEWPEPIQETFVGRFLRALKLDSSMFKAMSDEPKYLSHAAWMLILVNTLSAIGYGIYNLTIINANNSADFAFNVLFLGQISIDISVLVYPLIYVGLAVIKWLILSSLIYLIGTKILGSRTGFDSIATVTAFAYAPIALQIFLPLIFSNQPVTWGLAVFFVTNAWMILALLVGARQALEVPIERMIGIILIGGGIYWIIDYMAIVPQLEVPGIWFILKPATFVLLLFSIGTLLATLTGVFTKRFKFQ